MPGDRFIELAMTGDRHVLDVLFQHAREAITVQDAAGRLVYANDNAARLVGFKSAAEMLAMPVTELAARFEMVDASGAVLPIDALPGRRVLGGERVVEEVIGYRRRGDRRVRWSRVNASPIKNDQGQIVFAINYFLDITAQQRRDESRQLLATAHEMLGSSLDLEENLKTLAHLISPQMGSWCAVHLAEDDGTLSSVVVVHSESEGDAMVPQLGEGERIPLDSNRLQARVARGGKPEVIREITEEMLQAAEAEAAEFVAMARQLDLNSVFCLPLWRGNRVIGTMTVARGGPELPFDDDDLEIVEAVAERAAITLENARLYQQEHEVAELLQRGLMPRLLPE
ncbi:MAG TPA: GAF domain-containing protein, partial [Acidimicrobiia bacterium]|nr:GAF domain-containing protein [Acidimicrobiia bacterium]